MCLGLLAGVVLAGVTAEKRSHKIKDEVRSAPCP